MVTVAELLAGAVSVPRKLTAAGFAIDPVCLTVTFTTTVNCVVGLVPPCAEPPSLGIVQLTVPPSDPTAGPVQVPSVVVTELNCRLAGSVSTNSTLLACVD